MYLKKKLCVCVVVDYAYRTTRTRKPTYLQKNCVSAQSFTTWTSNFRTLRSNIFAKTKMFAKLFLPVHIGPRSNILSKTNNGPNSCGIVLCSNHLSFIANSDIYAVQFPLFCIQLTRICYTLLAKAVSNIVLHKNSEELSITNNDQLLQCTLYTYIDSTGMIIFYC